MINYVSHNKIKEEQTATPDKYPQGYFKDKPCKECGAMFSPKAPSELLCSTECQSRAMSRRYLKNTYGISLEYYEQLLEEHEHKCAICGSEGFTIGKNAKVKLAVDHDHANGNVRGLLCHNCNRALGLLQDNQEAIKKAYEYISFWNRQEN